MRYLSLFTGIGGFELGILQAHESHIGRLLQEQTHENIPNYKPLLEERQNGPTCVGYSEIDPYAIKIYQSHFPTHKNYGDITKLKANKLPDFDLLVGGFPCQAFSIAGKRKGFADTRGTLFFDIARILKSKKPRMFILENVKGLLSHDSGNTFKTIISTLAQLGYDLEWQVLNSKNFGVPQNRERVFIVGNLRGTPRPEVFPFRENGGSNNKQGELRPRCELLEGDKLHPIQKEETETACQPSGQIIRKDWNQPNDTDSRGGQTHTAYRIRRLTPTECERLQGFPDGWTEGISDTQRYKCLGNAVTVNVVKEIFNKLNAEI